MNKTEAQNLLSSLLDTPIVCNKIFAEITGLLSAGTLLTFLMRINTKTTKKLQCSSEMELSDAVVNHEQIQCSNEMELSDAVVLCDDVLQTDVGLSSSERYAAKRRLRHLDFIETKTYGHPIKTQYICNRQVIQEAVIARLSEMKKSITSTASLTQGVSTILQQRSNNKDNNIVYNISEKKEPSKKALRRKDFSYTKDDIWYQLAEYLLNQILKRRPNFFGNKVRTASQKDKKIKSWAKEFDYMTDKELDGRDPEETLDVLVWSQKDPFWQKVITSPYKVREKYGQLLDYKDGVSKKVQNVNELKDTHPDITEVLIRMYSKEFLGGRTPDWSIADTGKFVRASRKVSSFAKEANLNIKNIPKYIISCLKSNFTDHSKTVYPGNLCSDNTWNILLPQYLRELGISYKKNRNE